MKVDAQLESDLALGLEENALMAWTVRQARLRLQQTIAGLSAEIALLEELQKQEEAERTKFLAELGRRVERGRETETGENEPLAEETR